MPQPKLKIGGAMFAVALVAFAAGTFAQGRYGEIDRAEGALHSAVNDLQHAREVFGGHKGAAMRLINQALGELQEGKRFAAAHGN